MRPAQPEAYVEIISSVGLSFVRPDNSGFHLLISKLIVDKMPPTADDLLVVLKDRNIKVIAIPNIDDDNRDLIKGLKPRARKAERCCTEECVVDLVVLWFDFGDDKK